MTSRDSFPGLLLRKALQTLVSLLILIFLLFILLHHLPGGPFDQETVSNPVVRERMLKLWALDQPVIQQFFSYVASVLRGDLGVSLVSPDKTVMTLLRQDFVQSAPLVAVTLILVYVLSVTAAIISCWWENPWLNRGLDLLLVLGLSLPSLFLGPVLIYVFGFVFNLLPTAFLEHPQSFILPVFTLMLRPWAQLTSLFRNSLREILHLEYIRTAKAKGLASVSILVHHALKNAVIPVIAISGPVIVGIFSGTFMVEILFSIPGLGRQFIDSLNLRDYPVITGLVLFYGCALILLTQAFEVLTQAMDPRLRGQDED